MVFMRSRKEQRCSALQGDVCGADVTMNDTAGVEIGEITEDIVDASSLLLASVIANVRPLDPFPLPLAAFVASPQLSLLFQALS